MSNNGDVSYPFRWRQSIGTAIEVVKNFCLEASGCPRELSQCFAAAFEGRSRRDAKT